MSTFLLLLGIGLLVLFYPALRAAVRTYRKFRGTRVITCPETSARRRRGGLAARRADRFAE